MRAARDQARVPAVVAVALGVPRAEEVVDVDTLVAVLDLPVGQQLEQVLLRLERTLRVVAADLALDGLEADDAARLGRPDVALDELGDLVGPALLERTVVVGVLVVVQAPGAAAVVVVAELLQPRREVVLVEDVGREDLAAVAVLAGDLVVLEGELLVAVRRLEEVVLLVPRREGLHRRILLAEALDQLRVLAEGRALAEVLGLDVLDVEGDHRLDAGRVGTGQPGLEVAGPVVVPREDVPRDDDAGVPDAERLEVLVGEHVRVLLGDPDLELRLGGTGGRKGGACEDEQAEELALKGHAARLQGDRARLPGPVPLLFWSKANACLA